MFGGWLRSANLALSLATMVAAGVSLGTLCVGDDGHVAFELADGGRCLDAPQGADAASRVGPAPVLAPVPSDRHCGSCTDLTAGSGEWLAGSKAPQPAPGAALALADASQKALRSSPQPSASAHGQPAGRARAALRETVLRC